MVWGSGFRAQNEGLRVWSYNCRAWARLVRCFAPLEASPDRERVIY